MGIRDFCILDIETIDFKPSKLHIWSISGLKVKNMEIESIFESLVRPAPGFEDKFYRASGKKAEDFEGTLYIDQVAPRAYNFFKGNIIYAYNAPFDNRFMVLADPQFSRLHYKDYLKKIRDRYPRLSSYKLEKVAQDFGIDYTKNGFDSTADCYALFRVMEKAGL